MRKLYDVYIEGGGGGWQPIFGEWQLCPRCLGSGEIHGPFPSDSMTGINITKPCDVCGGAKVIQKPIINLETTS
jgi:DnaJ-class molecular chaperone